MAHRDTSPATALPTYRLSLISLVATVLLIMVGGFTRGSGSGYGCADRWPLCKNGLLGGLLPRGEYHMIIEWSHRWLAVTVGLLAVATAVSAWRHHRSERVIPYVSTATVATIGFQAWIGRAIVQAKLDADLVSLHLAISLTIAALLTVAVVSIRFHSGPRQDRDRSWTVLVAAGAGTVFTVIMMGSLVHNLYFPGWPLMSGELLPELTSGVAVIHFIHRVIAGLYLFGAVTLWAVARRRERPSHEVTMLGLAAALYAVNVGVGAAHVFTRVDSAALVALHLGIASTVLVLTLASVFSSLRTDQTRLPTQSSMETSR